jgi:hypothetical protein
LQLPCHSSSNSSRQAAQQQRLWQTLLSRPQQLQQQLLLRLRMMFSSSSNFSSSNCRRYSLRRRRCKQLHSCNCNSSRLIRQPRALLRLCLQASPAKLPHRLQRHPLWLTQLLLLLLWLATLVLRLCLRS